MLRTIAHPEKWEHNLEMYVLRCHCHQYRTNTNSVIMKLYSFIDIQFGLWVAPARYGHNIR